MLALTRQTRPAGARDGMEWKLDPQTKVKNSKARRGRRRTLLLLLLVRKMAAAGRHSHHHYQRS